VSPTGRIPAAITALALAVSALVVGSAAPAAAGVPIYDSAIAPIPSAVAPSSFALAAGKLFITDGDAVRVVTTGGSLVATLSGIVGARDAVAAPDRGTVYVVAAGSDEVVEIDPAVPRITTRYAVGACPHELAVSSTDVWYTFGCRYGEGGINHITRATGVVHAPGSPDADFRYGSARLGYGGGRLFAYDRDVTGWPAVDGSLGSPVVNTTDGMSDSDLVVSDSRVVLLNGAAGVPGFVLLDRDLVRQTVVPTSAGALAAAFSSSGDKLVAGGSSEIPFTAADPATGEVRHYARIPFGSGDVPWVMAAGMAISADGTRAFALAREFTDPTTFYVVTTSVDAPPPAPLTVSVTGLTYLGATGTITVRTLPRTKVTVKLATGNGAEEVTFPTDASGVLMLRVRSSYSGTVTATTSGDPTHASSARTVTFHVQAGMRTSMSKGYRTKAGVTYYRKFSQVKVYAAVGPIVPGRVVHATLFIKKRTYWKRVDTWSGRTNDIGVVGARIISNRKGVVMRVMFNFRGDRFNGGATEYTRPFVVR
jgi:hypothetical protein